MTDSIRAPRQLLIGVDAMEWERVSTWASEGRLPTLQGLMNRGLVAELKSVADCLPDTVWTTLCYGVNPGKLEKYFYVQYESATAGLRYVPDSALRGRPFWDHLGAAGRRVIVAEVPHLPFSKTQGGVHVMGFGPHDNKRGLVTDPPELEREIRERFGTHPVEDCERYNKNIASVERLRDGLLAGIRVHGELFRWLMGRSPWDVFFGVFPAAHCAGHHFWHREEVIEETYRAIDREIGAMVESAGPGTQVLVFAPHGMSALSHASWNLDEILDCLGYGAPGVEPLRRAGSGKASINPWRRLKMWVPPQLQYWIKDRLPRALQNHLVIRWYSARRAGRGRPTRRAFAVPNNEVTGSIRIGLRGRDAGGLVEPGPEYARALDDICTGLLELRDPQSGRAVVKSVTRVHDVYHGEFVDQLPDLAVQWETAFSWTALESARVGRMEIPLQDQRSGSHTANSFLIAAGPHIEAGARPTNASTLDLSASVLRNAGVEVPAHMDGAAIHSLGAIAREPEELRR